MTCSEQALLREIAASEKRHGALYDAFLGRQPTVAETLAAISFSMTDLDVDKDLARAIMRGAANHSVELMRKMDKYHASHVDSWRQDAGGFDVVTDQPSRETGWEPLFDTKQEQEQAVG